MAKKVDIYKTYGTVWTNGVRLKDTSMAKLVFSHMRIVDILNPFKVVQATLDVTSLISGKTPSLAKQKFKYRFK